MGSGLCYIIVSVCVPVIFPFAAHVMETCSFSCLSQKPCFLAGIYSRTLANQIAAMVFTIKLEYDLHNRCVNLDW